MSICPSHDDKWVSNVQDKAWYPKTFILPEEKAGWNLAPFQLGIEAMQIDVDLDLP